MIYAGLIKFGRLPISEDDLTKTIESFAQGKVSLVQKNGLILCYGKLSNTQDMDGIWENETSFLVGRAFDKENTCAFSKTTFKKLAHLSKEAILSKLWGK